MARKGLVTFDCGRQTEQTPELNVKLRIRQWNL